MSGKANYSENATLNYWCRGTAMPAVGGRYIALFTADAGLEAGTLTNEISGGGYARFHVDGSTYTLAQAAGTTNECANEQVWAYGEATAGWGTITHAALIDAASGGNVLYWCALTAPIAITAGQKFEFDLGQCKFSETGKKSDYAKNATLNYWCRGTAMPSVSGRHVALFLSDNGLETNNQTGEVSGGAYARFEVDGTTYTFSAATGATNECASEQVWDYPVATANYGVVNHSALIDAASGGNVLYYNALSASGDPGTPAPVQIDSGQKFRYPLGDCKVTED